ncbi:MAG: class I SAM-dependent methyltransferase [Verrucomicrobiae bacterium]|nr:class I SAM-dependent methyltransferase [Verrucomicrobiae bacterium]
MTATQSTRTDFGESLPRVVLKTGEEDRVIAGHPWIYAASVERVSPNATDGCVVRVLDRHRKFVGVGLYNSRSKINVRVLALEDVPIDAGFFAKRIEEALAVRRRYMPGAGCFRVVNSEGDFLSGLIVDKYDDVLVLQTSALGMDQRQDMIVEVLRSGLSPRAILARNDISTRKLEGLPETSGVLWGQNPGEITVKLHKLLFTVDLLKGHKTGLYLDQQLNYGLVSDLVAKRPGARVLDCFCFTGGFGLHAAEAGA